MKFFVPAAAILVSLALVLPFFLVRERALETAQRLSAPQQEEARELYILKISATPAVAPTPMRPYALQSEQPADNAPLGRDASVTLRLITSDGTLTLPLADYLAGVVFAEMPSSFHDEALRAQAVAARTHVWRRLELGGKHEDAELCSDPACCMAYADPDAAAARLGSVGMEYLSRIRAAVSDTDGCIVTSGGQPIDALFFSCSGGMTEDAQAVWGGTVEYLVSVESPGEESAPRYTDEKRFSMAELRELILSAAPEAVLEEPDSWLTQPTYTTGGGIDTLLAGGAELTGVQLRALLGLRSTRFSWVLEDDEFVFTTLGFGHRVGLSQYGADAMARAGSGFEEILAWYYRGTELEYRPAE